MKKLLLLFLFLPFLVKSQYAPSGTKTRWTNGVGFGSGDTTNYRAASDTNILIFQYKDSSLYYRAKGFYNRITTGSASGFLAISDSIAGGYYPYSSNPKNFIQRSSLSATVPLTYNNTTGIFAIPQATNVANGYLTSIDWLRFDTAYNERLNAVIFSSTLLNLLGADGISHTASVPTFNQNTTGSAAKWTTPRTISASGGDVAFSYTIDGSANATAIAATLATVNSNVGTFGTASSTVQMTVNGKGLGTAFTNVSILIAESQVTNLVTDLAAKLSSATAATTYLKLDASNGPLTGNLSTNGYIGFTANATQTVGTIGKNATYGIATIGAAGTLSDNTMFNSSSAEVYRNPTGTVNMAFAGSVDINSNLTSGKAATTSVYTLGAQNGDFASVIRLLGNNTYLNWQIGSNGYAHGDFSITPSTAAGGSSFTTPAFLINSSSQVLLGTITNPGSYQFYMTGTMGVSGLGTFGNSIVVSGSTTSGGQFLSTMGNNSKTFFSGSATTGYTYGEMVNTSGELAWGLESSTGGSLYTGTTAYSAVIGTGVNRSFHIATNNIVRATWSAAGDFTNTGDIFSTGGGLSTRLGASNTIGLGSIMTWDNALTSTSQRELGWQMNTSNGLDFWAYDGSLWTNTGTKVNFDGSITSNKFAMLGNSTTPSAGIGYNSTQGNYYYPANSGLTIDHTFYSSSGGVGLQLYGSAVNFQAAFPGPISTAIPSGGSAGAWKFGVFVSSVSTFNTGGYVQLDIGGTLYKLALVN